jgi:hypothetical protein
MGKEDSGRSSAWQEKMKHKNEFGMRRNGIFW